MEIKQIINIGIRTIGLMFLMFGTLFNDWYSIVGGALMMMIDIKI